MKAPKHVVARFRNRKDNKIMGLELFAVSLGLGTFQSVLAGRKVVIHSDNTGSEVFVLVCFQCVGMPLLRMFASSVQMPPGCMNGSQNEVPETRLMASGPTMPTTS